MKKIPKNNVLSSWLKFIWSKIPIFKKIKEIIRKWPITKPFSPSIKFVPFNKIKIQNNTNKKLKILFSRITSKKFNLVSTIWSSNKYIKKRINMAWKKILF